MNIPNLPTDNLYKFLSLTGLFIIVTSFGYKEYLHFQYELKNVEILVGKETLENTVKNKKDLLEMTLDPVDSLRIKSLRELTIKLNNELDTLKKENISDFKERFNLAQFELQLMEEENKKNIQHLLANADITWYINQSSELRLKSEIAEISEKRVEKLSFMLNITIFIGICSTITGFLLWYFKLQKYQDIILKKDSNI